MLNKKEVSKKIEICELEYAVGPAGSSEAVGALPCVVLAIGIAVYSAAQ